MNKHNKSLGNSSKNGSALNTDTKINKINSQTRKFVPLSRIDLAWGSDDDLESMRLVLVGINSYLNSDSTRQATPHIRKWVQDACDKYKTAVERSLGMPGFSDSVTTQREAPPDIPTVPLGNYQLVQRTCYIPKSATSGTTAGGFFATLNNLDLDPFVGTAGYFRIRKVTSWTVPRQDGNANQGSFAGVAVPANIGGGTTSAIMPIWSENWTPIGQGFAGIVTQFPLGDFPLYAASGTSIVITNHYTSLGNAGGVTGIPVVFHVEIETLI